MKFVTMFVTVAALAATAACAEQSDGLGGAALPQEAATSDEAVDQAAVEPILAPEEAQVDPSESLTDTTAVDSAAAAPDAAVQPTPDRSMAAMSTAGDDLWKRIIPAMAGLAGSRKPRHIPESMVYAVDNTMTIVLAAAEGVDKLTAANFESGAVVGYVYIAAKKANPGPTARPPMLAAGADASSELAALALPPRRCCLAVLLPQGYFGIRIVPDTSSPQAKTADKAFTQKWKAQYVDAAGRVVQEMVATVTEDPGTTPAPWTGVTIDRGGPLTLSVSSGRWKIDASRHIP